MKKILIIEDEQTLAETLSQKLRTGGYEVIVETDGLTGFNAIKERKPDLLLTDINLNSMNGYEILSKKQSDPAIAGIPTMVLSNSVEPFKVSDLAVYNAMEFVNKSITTPGEILQKVQAIFGDAVSEVEKSVPISIAGKKILLVEDDGFLRSIVLHRLSDDGAEVIQASSGEAALEELKKQTPDLILLDLLLPGMGGFDVLKLVREKDETKKLPVIVISNFNQQVDKEKAEQLGASFMVKALVTPDEISEAVKNHLSH